MEKVQRDTKVMIAVFLLATVMLVVPVSLMVRLVNSDKKVDNMVVRSDAGMALWFAGEGLDDLEVVSFNGLDYVVQQDKLFVLEIVEGRRMVRAATKLEAQYYIAKFG